MAGNTNFTTLITTTLQNFGKEIFDNVVTNNALLNTLKSNGNIKVVGGGRQFTHPLRHALNNTFAARARSAAIPLTVQDHITRSQWDVKVVDGSVVLNEVELAMNAGDREKLIDLAVEMKDSAVSSLSEVMGDQVFSTSVGANDLDSIPRIVSTVPTADTDVGGIDSTASGNSYWRNQVYSTAVTAFGTGQAGLNAMSTLLRNCIFGNKGPTAIFTTKAVFTLYELALTNNTRYTQMTVGDGGFHKLVYETIPVYFDDNCPANRMYFVDTTAIMLQVLRDGNFRVGEFQESETQLVKRALVWVACNITCGE